MNVTAIHRHRVWILAAAAALTLWGMIGLFGNGAGYTGALYWHDYTIPEVRPGSPLDEAGFQPGDLVVSVEGIPIEKLGMYSRWPRFLSRRPGESIQMVVEREGELVRGEVVYRERPGRVSGMRLGASLIAVSFLWFGMWAFFTTPTRHGLRLAAIGLVTGLALPGPNLGTWNGVKDHIQIASMVLWVLFLLRFYLFFPRPKRPALNRLVTGLLYAPWLILLFCLVLELAYHPRFYHSFGGFYGMLMLVYGGLALAAVIHTGVTTSREDLRESGMAIVLWAILVAVLPNLVAVAGWFIPPGFDIPGSSFFPLLLAVIPLGMALGVRKHSDRFSTSRLAKAG
jgi:hypothetical protein